MGKSIVHCADCGKAIREDDFAKGQASTIDSRTYCSTCRPVSPSALKAQDLRKGSNSRLPLASSLTPKRGTPAVSERSRVPLLVAGAAVAIALATVIGFALSGNRGPIPAEPPAEAGPRKLPGPAAGGTAKRSPSPVENPASKVAPAQPGSPKSGAAPDLRPDSASKAAARESIAPPQPRLVDPLDGSTIDASADILLEAQARDPQGRIARIEFWQGTLKLGETNDVPYRCLWKGPRAAGSYELRAKSIDRDGAESSSDAVRIAIQPVPEPEQPTPAAESPAPSAGQAAKDAPAVPEMRADPKKDPLPQVDAKKVELAIKKGIQYLNGQVGKMPTPFADDPNRICHSNELLLWTYVHAGVPESSGTFRYLFKAVTEAEVRRTYEVSLQAMILEEIDRVRYQERLQHCAQFLADNQCANGQWGYGEPPVKDIPTIYGALPVPTSSRTGGGPSGDRQKPLVVRKLKVTPRRSGPAEGDNSNSQYAALGIRACTDAGIAFPEDLLDRARKWLRGSQHDPEGAAAGSVATGMEAAVPRGWCYAGKDHRHGSYGSMTAGAIGGIAIYDTLLGEDWRKDGAVASGISWLARSFSVSGNPGPPSEEWAKSDPKCFHFYYMYAVERAGVLCRTEWFGRHAWYAEGTNILLAAQGRDGSWNASPIDTCFAILFLKRVTRPLEDVASMDERPRK